MHAYGSRSLTGTVTGLLGLEKAVLTLEINAEYLAVLQSGAQESICVLVPTHIYGLTGTRQYMRMRISSLPNNLRTNLHIAWLAILPSRKIPTVEYVCVRTLAHWLFTTPISGVGIQLSTYPSWLSSQYKPWITEVSGSVAWLSARQRNSTVSYG